MSYFARSVCSFSSVGGHTQWDPFQRTLLPHHLHQVNLLLRGRHGEQRIHAPERRKEGQSKQLLLLLASTLELKFAAGQHGNVGFSALFPTSTMLIFLFYSSRSRSCAYSSLYRGKSACPRLPQPRIVWSTYTTRLHDPVIHLVAILSSH